MDANSNKYYFPKPSGWPVTASIALLTMLAGVANWLHSQWFGPYMWFAGFLLLLYVMHGWFGRVITENRQGLMRARRNDHSFRYAMLWFIFSEVMFFSSFFGALFYIRLFVLPDMGAADSMDHVLLYPDFNYTWPLQVNPDPADYQGPHAVMSAWGIAAINTLILLTSGLTVTIAHFALMKNQRRKMLIAQFITICLGISFLCLQANEYIGAYTMKGMTLASGIYGTTFFMLTGFHGLHVTIGTIGLSVIFYRMLRHDFSPENHFGFEAVAWYWHFVDIVWLLLFIFVYWL